MGRPGNEPGTRRTKGKSGIQIHARLERATPTETISDYQVRQWSAAYNLDAEWIRQWAVSLVALWRTDDYARKERRLFPLLSDELLEDPFANIEQGVAAPLEESEVSYG